MSDHAYDNVHRPRQRECAGTEYQRECYMSDNNKGHYRADRAEPPESYILFSVPLR